MVNFVGRAAASYELAFALMPPPVNFRAITGEIKLVRFAIGDTAKK